MDEQQFTKPSLDKFRQWHFWWLVVFSILMVTVFVWYLPIWFLYQASLQGGHAHTAIYQEAKNVTQGLSVNLTSLPAVPDAGQKTVLNFSVNNKPGNIPVPVNDLGVEHAKVMHVIGVRSDMNEFFHVHPVMSDELGVLTTDYNFTKPGRYKIWSEVNQNGQNYVYGQPELAVRGVGETENKQVNYDRSVVVGNYLVTLIVKEPVVKGVVTRLSFNIRTLAGQTVSLENFLEAQMHLSVIRDDWKEFIHAHPNPPAGTAGHQHSFLNLADYARADVIATPVPTGTTDFDVVFPSDGIYRAYGQFRPKGINLPSDEALMAAFWIKVGNGVTATPVMENMTMTEKVMPTPSNMQMQNQPVSSPMMSGAPMTGTDNMNMADKNKTDNGAGGGMNMSMPGMVMGPSNYSEEAGIKTGLAVNLNISPVPYKTGVPLRLDFFVNQKPGNAPVSISELQVNHEKIMHVIGVRSDLNEFFHIHPVPVAAEGHMIVEHIINKPGSYKIWSEISKNDQNFVYGHVNFDVTGQGSVNDKKVSFERNVKTAGDFNVTLNTNGAVVKNRPAHFGVDVNTFDNRTAELEPYLGMDMHMTIIRDDLKEFIHTHPTGVTISESEKSKLFNVAMAHDSTGALSRTLDFMVTFPEAGVYKVFAQFRPRSMNLAADDSVTAEFWVRVEEKPPLPINQWWLLLIVSIVAIAILSYATKRYLVVN